MRRPLKPEDVEQLYATAGTPDQRRAAATQLAEWAEEVHPDDDEITPALLLVEAQEHLSQIGDHGAALEAARRAVAAPGEVPPDVRCYLHRSLLATGNADEARQLADELRRERPADGFVYVFVGENYEVAGDLSEAHRWMTMGLVRMLDQVERGRDAAAGFAAALVASRHRVRRALDLPFDDFDMLAEGPPGGVAPVGAGAGIAEGPPDRT